MHGYYGYGMGGDIPGREFGYGFGFEPFHALFLLLLVAAAIALIVWLVVRRRHAVVGTASAAIAPTPAVDPAISIARERLASGQIDAEQYASIVATLNG